MMQLRVRYAVQSETGLRSNNEDAAFVGPYVVALADGMGGHAGGEVAASLALREVAALDEGGPRSDHVDALRDAIERANAALDARAAVDPETAGMGTTLTALFFDADYRRVALAHVGDSRAYMLRNDRLSQLTTDDTFVQALVDEGRLLPEEATNDPRRSIVTKVLRGGDVDPFTEVREVDVGDRYLICSDGLSDFVPDEMIERIMRINDPLRRPQELIRLALRAGSHDNITCAVVDVVPDHASGWNIAITAGAPGMSATVVPS